MRSNVFTMFAGFCGHEDKNHIYAVLTVTTGPFRATTMLLWPSVKMSLTPLFYSVNHRSWRWDLLSYCYFCSRFWSFSVCIE